MRLRTLITNIAFVAISLVFTVSAQSLPSDNSSVSLDSCRSMALANNKKLKMKAEGVKMAHYQNREAFAAYLPSIDFAGGYMYNQKELSMFSSDQYLPVKSFDLQKQSYEFNLVKNPITDEPVIGPNGQPIPEQVAYLPKDALTYDIHNVFFGAVTLTQPIYMGGKIVAMNKLTHYAEELARQLHSNEAENVVYAVDAAYWQVVSLKAKYKLAVKYVALIDTLRSNVEAMVRQGVATKSDLLKVNVRLNEAQVDLTKVDNGLVLSRMALAQVCGLPVNTVFPLVDEDREETSLTAPVAANYNMNDVYNRRADLKALEYGVKIYRQKEKVAMSSMLPNVALVGAYSFSNPNLYDGFSKKFSGAFSVGAMVTIPIWHWGGNYNKIKAAKTQVNIAQLELADAKDLIDLQVSQAAFKTQEAIKTFHMTQSNIANADENLRQATLGFREGVMTTTTVMEAQTAWLKAHSEKVDAMIEVQLCDVYLSKVLGSMNISE